MSDFRVLCLPYCLKRLEDGRYVALNRRYKPLGFTTQAHVEYEAYPIALRLRMTPQRAAALSWQGSDDTAMIHLYNDGCVPTSSAAHMQAYLGRLATLAAYTVAEERCPDEYAH
jgi:hypothetical protein